MSRNNYDYSVYYRIWHDESDQHAQLMAEHFAKILGPHLPIARSATVLDVGCGMGFALLGLKQLGFSNIQGVERDHSQYDACKRRGLDVSLITDTEAYLLANPQAYDVILLLDVLEHIHPDSQIPLLKRIYASLKNTGRLLVQAPNANSIIGMRWLYNDHTHYCSFTEHSLKYVLQNSGFERVEYDIRPIKCPQLSYIFRKGKRREFKKWIIRWLWHQVVAAEMDVELDTNTIPFGVNILALAHKDG